MRLKLSSIRHAICEVPAIPDPLTVDRRGRQAPMGLAIAPKVASFPSRG